jgi:hypothetical protein
VDATGVEVLREIWHRQTNGGGDLLLSGLPPRAETFLRRSGFIGEIGESRLFWSADRAILSLGKELSPIKSHEVEEDTFEATLFITPHEERGQQQL